MLRLNWEWEVLSCHSETSATAILYSKAAANSATVPVVKPASSPGPQHDFQLSHLASAE